jgi:ssDNA thymidine ADP-ribosyltransferase DarT-like protein
MHFTHVANLPAIVAEGAILADSLLKQQHAEVRECADLQIKSSRREIAVKVAPGGKVGQYVPFYFAARSPMLYKISRGSVPTFTGPQSDLVYFVSSFRRVHSAGLRWVGSDGNCAAAMTTHCNDWVTLEGTVDWPLMKEQWWSNTESDGDRMRRRMAELLVYERFPLSVLAGIVVMTDEMSTRVASHLGPATTVRVRPDWYY